MAQETYSMEDRVLALEERVAMAEQKVLGAHEVAKGAQRIAQTIADEHNAWRTRHLESHEKETAEHKAEHERLATQIDERHKAAMKAIDEAFELLGRVGADLGGKATAISEQAKRIETESKKISAQAWATSKIGLLVVLGASVGGGLVQSCVSLLTHR